MDDISHNNICRPKRANFFISWTNEGWCISEFIIRWKEGFHLYSRI